MTNIFALKEFAAKNSQSFPHYILVERGHMYTNNYAIRFDL